MVEVPVCNQYVCTQCKKLLDSSAFSNKAEKRNGKASKCRACLKLKAAEYYSRPDKKVLIRGRSKAYYESNKQDILQKGKILYEKKKTKIAARAAARYADPITGPIMAARNNARMVEFRKKNPELANKISRAQSKKDREALADGYIKSVICSDRKARAAGIALSKKDVPQVLIEAKRIQLKLQREYPETRYPETRYLPGLTALRKKISEKL